MKIGYIQEINLELNPGQERFRFREATCTRTINSRGDRVRSKMLMFPVDYEEIVDNANIRITFDEFLAISDNIISTSACLASPLNKLADTHPRYMELARKYDFFEVQAHNHPEQIEFNKRLLALAKQLGKPLIAGTDTHSSSPYKAECRAILLSAKHKSYGDEDAFDLTYKTYDELVEMFRVQGALPEDASAGIL